MNVSVKAGVKNAVRLLCFILVVLQTDISRIFAISGPELVRYLCQYSVVIILHCTILYFIVYHIILCCIISD